MWIVLAAAGLLVAGMAPVAATQTTTSTDVETAPPSVPTFPEATPKTGTVHSRAASTSSTITETATSTASAMRSAAPASASPPTVAGPSAPSDATLSPVGKAQTSVANDAPQPASETWRYALPGSPNNDVLVPLPNGNVAARYTDSNGPRSGLVEISHSGTTSSIYNPSAESIYTEVPVVGPDNTLYMIVQTSDFSFHLEALRDGVARWNVPISYYRYGGQGPPILGADGNVWAVESDINNSDSCWLQSFSTTNGDSLQRVDLPSCGRSTSGESVLPDAVAYSNGIVVPFGPSIAWVTYGGKILANIPVPPSVGRGLRFQDPRGTSDAGLGTSASLDGAVFLQSDACSDTQTVVVAKMTPAGIAWNHTYSAPATLCKQESFEGTISALPDGGVVLNYDSASLSTGVTVLDADGSERWRHVGDLDAQLPGTFSNIYSPLMGVSVDRSGMIGVVQTLWKGDGNYQYNSIINIVGSRDGSIVQELTPTLVSTDDRANFPGLDAVAFDSGRVYTRVDRYRTGGLTYVDSDVYAFDASTVAGNYPISSVLTLAAESGATPTVTTSTTSRTSTTSTSTSTSTSSTTSTTRPTSATASGGPSYFALGDSIPSGHGLTGGYYDLGGPHPPGSSCNRSNLSYPFIIASDLIKRHKIATFLPATNHLACNGQPSQYIRDEEAKAAAEAIKSLPKVASRRVDAYVSLDAGIDDFHFASDDTLGHLACDSAQGFQGWINPIIERVMTNLYGPLSPPDPSSPTFLTDLLKGGLPDRKPDEKAILPQLLSASPGRTRIVLHGLYNPVQGNLVHPLVLAAIKVSATQCPTLSFPLTLLKQAQIVSRIASTLEQLDSAYQNVVELANSGTGSQVRFVSLLGTFANHVRCDGGRSYVQPFVLPLPDLFPANGNDCVHPSVAGAKAIAAAVERALLAS